MSWNTFLVNNLTSTLVSSEILLMQTKLGQCEICLMNIIYFNQRLTNFYQLHKKIYQFQSTSISFTHFSTLIFRPKKETLNIVAVGTITIKHVCLK